MSEDPPDLPQAAITALEQGSKIEAIKEVRIARSVGLKEAKEIVEDFIEKNSEIKSYMRAANANSARSGLRWLIVMILIAIAIYYSRGSGPA